MSMAAFEQKHKEAASESGGKKKDNTRKSTSPKTRSRSNTAEARSRSNIIEARSRSNTAEVHESSLSSTDQSGFSGDRSQVK